MEGSLFFKVLSSWLSASHSQAVKLVPERNGKNTKQEQTADRPVATERVLTGRAICGRPGVRHKRTVGNLAGDSDPRFS